MTELSNAEKMYRLIGQAITDVGEARELLFLAKLSLLLGLEVADPQIVARLIETAQADL